MVKNRMTDIVQKTDKEAKRNSLKRRTGFGGFYKIRKGWSETNKFKTTA
jgi:hypothetical protein